MACTDGLTVNFFISRRRQKNPDRLYREKQNAPLFTGRFQVDGYFRRGLALCVLRRPQWRGPDAWRQCGTLPSAPVFRKLAFQ